MSLYQNSPSFEVEVRYLLKIQMKEINTFESVDMLDHSILQAFESEPNLSTISDIKSTFGEAHDSY